jgi:FAD/FMN-containing dehydrogenase
MRRPWRYGPSFSDEENAKILDAARRAGLTPTGYIAEAALRLADHDHAPGAGHDGGKPGAGISRAEFEALAELQSELFDARTAVVRTGTNLNQAVAALNATGQAPEWLVTVASMCARTLAGVDAVISGIDRRVRT